MRFRKREEKKAFHQHHFIRWVLNIYRMEARITKTYCKRATAAEGFCCYFLCTGSLGLGRRLATTGREKKRKRAGDTVS